MEKRVKIKGISYLVSARNYAMYKYEEMRGKSVNEIMNFTDVLALTYCSIIAGAKLEGKSFEMTFDEFVLYSDTHPEVMNVSEKKSEADLKDHPQPREDMR